MTTRASRGRLRLASVVVVLGAVIAFAALGGTGFAGGLAKKPKPAKAQYGQYQNAAKITVCHKGKVTIRVGAPAANAHKAHGDDVGACTQTSAAKAKKSKSEDKGKKSKNEDDDADESASSENGKSNNGKAKGKNKD